LKECQRETFARSGRRPETEKFSFLTEKRSLAHLRPPVDCVFRQRRAPVRYRVCRQRVSCREGRRYTHTPPCEAPRTYTGCVSDRETLARSLAHHRLRPACSAPPVAHGTPLPVRYLTCTQCVPCSFTGRGADTYTTPPVACRARLHAQGAPHRESCLRVMGTAYSPASPGARPSGKPRTSHLYGTIRYAQKSEIRHYKIGNQKSEIAAPSRSNNHTQCMPR
jgi:hypothetical protein